MIVLYGFELLTRYSFAHGKLRFMINKQVSPIAFTGCSLGIWVATGKMILHDVITVLFFLWPLGSFREL